MSLIEPMAADPTGDGLYSLVYTSSAVEPFTPGQLAGLLRQSRAHNAADDITGMLLYRRDRFIQFLEGPEDAVRALLARIAADPRHERVRVLVDGYAPDRQLADWTMGYEQISDAPVPPPPGFRDTFDDLENGDDGAVIRAVRELAFWFRARAS